MNQAPIIFSCSGCSEAGKITYDLGRLLTTKGIGEMSCLAGLAAELKPFKVKIKNRNIWLIDGCPIHCSKNLLEKMGIPYSNHISLNDYGIKKENNKPVNTELLATTILKDIK